MRFFSSKEQEVIAREQEDKENEHPHYAHQKNTEYLNYSNAKKFQKDFFNKNIWHSESRESVQ